MKTPLPRIKESIEYLNKLMKREKGIQRHMRLQFLYLVQTCQVRSKKAASDLLGVHRHTIGAWSKLYEERGLRGILEIRPSVGAPRPMTDTELRRLRWRLSQPKGFGSYREIQQWIAKEFDVELSLRATFYWVHTKLGAKPKVVRPSHRKKKQKNARSSKRDLRLWLPESKKKSGSQPHGSNARSAGWHSGGSMKVASVWEQF